MNSRIVAVSIDKVQTFLYEVIHAATQEKQGNSETLRTIIGASKAISERFFEDLGITRKQGVFSDQIDMVLLRCSGNCIFATALSENDVMEKLGKLFHQYYKNFNGQLLLKYVSFEQSLVSDDDKLKAIYQGKKLLKQKDCLGMMVAQHKELLFQFCDIHDSDYREEKTSNYKMFAPNINSLFLTSAEDNDNSFRIAVIKGDLDGMGNLLHLIKDYSVYQKISDVLYECIHIDYLAGVAAKVCERDPEFKLYPLYMAGDDILFAVPISKLISGIEVCQTILKNINTELCNPIGRPKMNPTGALSMSIGIDFTFNREPIRYYYERVERQLECAKRAETPDKLKKKAVVKIAINDSVFYAYDAYDKTLSKFPYWPHFLNDLKKAAAAEKAEFKIHHFLYGLLNKITDPNIQKNPLKYSNVVLYHLIPSYLNSPDINLTSGELLMIEMLIRQVTVGKTSHSFLLFGEKQQKDLESYVRLLLLFTDSRFQMISKPKTGKQDKFDKKKCLEIRSKVFNRSLRYLYKENLNAMFLKRGYPENTVESLCEIFVQESVYDSESVQNVDIYQTIKLSSCLLHRMKHLGVDVDMNANMMKSVNDKGKEEYELQLQESRRDKKPAPCLPFDEEKFKKIAVSSGLWTADYIDTLLVFYSFKECMIQFKRLYCSQNAKKPDNNKKSEKSEHLKTSKNDQKSNGSKTDRSGNTGTNKSKNKYTKGKK